MAKPGPVYYVGYDTEHGPNRAGTRRHAVEAPRPPKKGMGMKALCGAAVYARPDLFRPRSDPLACPDCQLELVRNRSAS